jgi:pyridoxine 5-phosphate synthase
MEAGADGITVHLREDRRHIRDSDVEKIRAARLGVLNLEMAATTEMANIASRILPDVVTLVPEKREERTTEGGLDVLLARASILQIGDMCKDKQIKLSLFIEASEEQVRASHEVGAEQVEFHTGHYCDEKGARRAEHLRHIEASILLAQSLGLEVALGHGLNRQNVREVARLPGVSELNIGHSVVSDAVLFGLKTAVTELRAVVGAAKDLSKNES